MSAAPPARYWSTREDGRIHCELCPRGCNLSDGQRAFCFVRENRGGTMVLSTYGRSSGFCIDPIEKKPLNHFLPGTGVLSFGTAGCNLGCKFCQNWSISKAREWERLSSEASPQAIAEAAQRTNATSVAFTYNDPVIFAEYAIDTAVACRERGIKSVAVTAGYISPGARDEFFAVMDAVNIDLKAFSDEFYRSLAYAELKPVLDTLEHVSRSRDTWLEITTLLIPGHNDSADELRDLSRWVAEHLGPEVPLHFTAFHPDYKMSDTPRTPAATLKRARDIARDIGLRHVYTGNVSDPNGQSTYCGSCGELLIERDRYRIGAYRLTDGACGNCGTPLAGLFTARAGSFGARRLPVCI